MSRLLIAALLLSLAAMPAMACSWNQSADADGKPSKVAAQPDTDQTTPPPPAQPADQKAG
jgi:hypothetical protein